MVIIVCPHCSTELHLSDADPPEVRSCPQCGGELGSHPGLAEAREPVERSAPTGDEGEPLAAAEDAPEGELPEAGFGGGASAYEVAPGPLPGQELADPPIPPPGSPPATRARVEKRFESLPVRPWRRYFARGVDLWIVALAAGVLLWNLLPEDELLVGLLVMLIWIPIEALLLSTWGTTPGKWLFATRVRTMEGNRLSFLAALKRTADVMVRGLGLGVPILSLVTLAVAYNTLTRDTRASWDAAAGWEVGHREVGLPQIIALAVIAVLALVIMLFAFVPSFGIEGDLITAVENFAASFEKMGATVRFIGDVRTGELSSNEQVVLDLELEEGVEILIYGVCDLDCFDLDLAVAGSDGETIAIDEQPDAEPVAHFTPEASGGHAITVTMYDCRLEPCYYAVGVMALEGLKTGPNSGTCFAVSPEGLVMTAFHVVDSDEVIHVQFADGAVTEAEMLRFSEAHDVALLDTGAARRDYLTFADVEALAVGEPVFTIGFPAPEILGSEPKFTEGTVSSLTGPAGDDAFLQMSVPVQPGNSGGPLVNHEGLVVGVVTSTVGSRSFEAETGALPQNINWAVKGTYAAPLLVGPPGSMPPTTRGEAIQRVQAAICSVVTGEVADKAASRERKARLRALGACRSNGTARSSKTASRAARPYPPPS